MKSWPRGRFASGPEGRNVKAQWLQPWAAFQNTWAPEGRHSPENLHAYSPGAVPPGLGFQKINCPRAEATGLSDFGPPGLGSGCSKPSISCGLSYAAPSALPLRRTEHLGDGWKSRRVIAAAFPFLHREKYFSFFSWRKRDFRL